MAKKLSEFDDLADASGGMGTTTASPTTSITQTPAGNPLAGFDANAYLAANPDVAAQVAQQLAAQTTQYDEQGQPIASDLTAEVVAQQHYLQYGIRENRPGTPNYQAPGTPTQPIAPNNPTMGSTNETATPTAGTPADASGITPVTNTPVPTSTPDLLTSITGTYNQTISQLAQQTQQQTQQIGDLATSLTGSLVQQQQTFAQSQADLLDRMQAASADQTAQMAKALKDLQDSSNSTGQAAKKPNYARALARNREQNSNGLSSTMVTGPGGAGAGTLGTTSILGA